MSKVINLLAIGGAAAITGYFIYKVILPQLKDFQWPTWQFPDFSQMQQQPSQYGSQPQQPEEPTPQQEDEEDSKISSTPQQQQQPPPAADIQAPPIPSGQIIWSSKSWANGVQRSISGHHQKDPNDPKVEIAAGSGRNATFDGKGTCFLSGARARLYIFANNYNSQMQLTYIHNSSLDNLSLRLRSHRDESGGFGGYKLVINRNSIECAMQTAYQGSNPKLEGGDKPLPQAIPTNTPITVKWHLKDNGPKIESTAWIDFGSGFKHVITAYQSNPPTVARDKTAFLKSSIAWIRTNGGSPKNIPIKNVSIINLGDVATPSATTQFLRFSNPYLYNSFYNRRRL